MENETLEEKLIRFESADWDNLEVVADVLATIKEIGGWQNSMGPEMGDTNHFMLLFQLDSLVKEKAPDIWAEVHKDDGVQELYKQLEDSAEKDGGI